MAARTKRAKRIVVRKRTVRVTEVVPARTAASTRTRVTRTTVRSGRRPAADRSLAKVVDDMTHAAKGTVAGAGGFSTNPGSQRPILGTLAGLDPEARRGDDLPQRRRRTVKAPVKRRTRR
jgi:hypothetical protein